MALVSSSVRSRRSFCSSIRHIVPTRESSCCGVAPLTETAGGAASGTDIANPSSIELVAGHRPEHIVQSGTRSELGHQVRGGAQGPDPAAVHERDALAVLL